MDQLVDLFHNVHDVKVVMGRLGEFLLVKFAMLEHIVKILFRGRELCVALFVLCPDLGLGVSGGADHGVAVALLGGVRRHHLGMVGGLFRLGTIQLLRVVCNGRGEFAYQFEQSLGPAGSCGSVAFSARSTSAKFSVCLLYTSPSPRDATLSRMPSSA